MRRATGTFDVLENHEEGAVRATGVFADAIKSAFGSFADFKGKFAQPAWAGLARVGLGIVKTASSPSSPRQTRTIL